MTQIKDTLNELAVKSANISNKLVFGGTEVTSTASELNILDGVTATASELNTLDGIATTATITVGAEGGDAINVAVQLKDAGGTNVAVRQALAWYLASDSTGATPSGTAPSGGTASGTNGKIIEWVAQLSGLMVFNATGQCDINITEAGVATWYLVVVTPQGKLLVSGAITFA
jgi:hypothetical protein